MALCKRGTRKRFDVMEVSRDSPHKSKVCDYERCITEDYHQVIVSCVSYSKNSR